MSGRLIILPKKQWHVRNQDNIDRVRKDEAEAAAAEAEVERRALLAEKEARIRLMRERASARKASLIGPQPEGALEGGGGGGGGGGEGGGGEGGGGGEEDRGDLAGVVHREVTDSSGHINFFQEVQAGEDKVTTNAEHEEEKKKEQEAYEKSVGYLVKLGQDTEETTGEVPWWKRGGSAQERLLLPTQSQLKAVNGPLSAIRAKQTDFLDPLNSVRKYLGCEGVRLTMKSHQKVIEEKERKALEFEEPEKKGKKRKRSRSRSKERKKRKRSRSRSKEKKKKSKSRSERKRRRSRSRESSHKKRRKEKKRRQRSSSSSSSSDEEDAVKKAEAKRNLERMRRERLERERGERQRADRLVFGECEDDRKKKKEEEVKEQKQKYSSQFNPELAKQNKLDPKRKYWLE